MDVAHLVRREKQHVTAVAQTALIEGMHDIARSKPTVCERSCMSVQDPMSNNVDAIGSSIVYARLSHWD